MIAYIELGATLSLAHPYRTIFENLLLIVNLYDVFHAPSSLCDYLASMPSRMLVCGAD